MGHYVFRGNQTLFVEDGQVYSCPGGPKLDLHPETLEPLAVEPATVPFEAPQGFRGEDSDAQERKEIGQVEPTGNLSAEPVHLIKCKSKGRGGRYTDKCPKCEELKVR